MKKLLLITFSFLLFSCGSDPDIHSAGTKTNSDSDTTPSEKPVIVVHRAKQTSIPAKAPEPVKLSKPFSFPANGDVVAVSELTSVDAAKILPVRTPGKDTLTAPKTMTVQPFVTLCRQPVPVHALSPRFKDGAISDIQYLDVDQGMSSSMIKCIVTDKKGNIWIGTNGAGVSRYDGRSFFHFTTKNGLSNNTILCIFQDSKGRIWFGTEDGGVCFYDGVNFNTISEDEGLGNNTVLSVYESKDGKIWIGTNGGGVYSYFNDRLTSYSEEEGLPNNSVRCITQDNKGQMWFGTTGGGACMFDGTSFHLLGEEEGLNSTIIHTIYQDKHGNIYLGTDDGGVNIYDGKTVEYITKKRGLSSDCIISIHEDKDENLWLGTYDSGLCLYNGEEIRIYTTEHGLTNNYVLSITEDNGGSLWLATYGGGICKFNNKSFRHYTAKEGMGANTVRSIVEDKNGTLCFSTYGDGLIFYNGQSFDHYTDNEGLPSNRFKASVRDSDAVWFATEDNGAVRFDGNKMELFSERTGLVSDYLLSICRSKDGNIWFGTDEKGVCCYTGKEFYTFEEEEGLSDGIISAIIQDKTGHMWFATKGSGVCNYDGEYFKWYTTKSGLSSNYITCMYEDRDGNLWFGTEGKGVDMLKAESINSKEPVFENRSMKNGLSDNTIRSIIQDNTGHVWIATERGLNYVFNNKQEIEVHTYTSVDGLKANNFFNSVIIDKKNIIWWGNGKALTNLHLNNFKLPSATPVIQMNNIEIEKSFVDFYAIKDSSRAKEQMIVGEKDKKDLRKIQFETVEKYYNYPKGLVLPYNLGQVEFEFSALDWNGPDKIKYQYMLVGADEDWSPLTSENKAFYNNISNGDYTFKVKAIGVSGKWSDTFEYTFSVLPPWYKHPMAYAGYVIGFIFVVFGFNGVRTKQLKVRQQELERTVAERTAEVVQQKELIEEKQIEILDSISYAKRIQSAMLASDHLFSSNLNSYFVLFQPKDIVSGDFYWASPIEDNKFVIVTADSTGHGVPGAMMSMLNISCVNEAINERKLYSPAAILNYARQRIISSLAMDGSEEGGKDGMDCSVIVFDLKNMKMTIAMANNPVWLIRNVNGTKECIEFKPDRMPVGKHTRDNVSFNETIVDLMKGDNVYALTDGFCDQFGGPNSKKYTYRRLKEELIKIDDLTSENKKQHLEKSFENWKGVQEQIDDVLIIGVKI
ncbi:MAG TPA: two-component regulator propeller domain-containing protein [Bacteroidia bacterium]|nr:two-component regulator propeller domain-containing protein [Bacteroidia bacterium]